MPGLDYAGIISAGMQLVPDFQQQTNRRLQGQIAETQLQAAQREAADENAFTRDAAAVWAHPNAESVSRLMAMYPKHAAAMKKAWDAQHEQERQRSLTELGSILYAARRGDWDRAHVLANRWYDAESRGGTLDDTDREVYRIIENGTPEERATVGGLIAFQLATAVGADKFAQAFPDLQREFRLQDLHPSELALREAEAASAPSYYSARAGKEQSEALSAASNAKYADAKNAADVERSGAATANLWSLIKRRASMLGKNPAQLTERDLGGDPSPKKSRKKGQKDLIATDGKGNRVRLNRSTNSWEPF